MSCATARKTHKQNTAVKTKVFTAVFCFLYRLLSTLETIRTKPSA